MYEDFWLEDQSVSTGQRSSSPLASRKVGLHFWHLIGRPVCPLELSTQETGRTGRPFIRTACIHLNAAEMRSLAAALIHAAGEVEEEDTHTEYAA